MLVNAVAGEGVGERWDGVTWPAPRQLASFETFPVMPETHAVYAFTWWSLAAFGIAAASRLLRAPKALPAAAATAAAAAAAATTAAATTASQSLPEPQEPPSVVLAGSTTHRCF